MTQRITQSIHFDTGIREADYSEKPIGQPANRQSNELLPAGTTVTEAIQGVFQNIQATASNEIMHFLVAQFTSANLRTPAAFHKALRNALQNIRQRKGKHSAAAARILEELLADTDLLDHYRASLLES